MRIDKVCVFTSHTRAHTLPNHDDQSYFTTLTVASAGHISTQKHSQPLDNVSRTSTGARKYLSPGGLRFWNPDSTRSLPPQNWTRRGWVLHSSALAK